MQPARRRSGVGRQDVDPRRRTMAGRFSRFGRDDTPATDNGGAVATDERGYATDERGYATDDTGTGQRTSVLPGDGNGTTTTNGVGDGATATATRPRAAGDAVVLDRAA